MTSPTSVDQPGTVRGRPAPTPPAVRRGLPDGAVRLLGIVVGVVLWEFLGRVLQLSFFPPASAVFARMAEMIIGGEIWPSLRVSLQNLGYGLVIMFAIGLPVGVLMGVSHAINAALEPYVNTLLAAPSLVFAPIFFSLFGLSRWSIVSLIVFYGVFILILNTATAVGRPRQDLIEMADSLCATRWQKIRWVVLPGAMPLLMTGVRVASGRAVEGMINGEMLIAVIGLGFIVQSAGQRFDATTVLAVLFVIVGIALLVGRVVEVLDRRVTRWVGD